MYKNLISDLFYTNLYEPFKKFFDREQSRNKSGNKSCYSKVYLKLTLLADKSLNLMSLLRVKSLFRLLRVVKLC